MTDTVFVGKQLQFLASVDSTNSHLRDLMNDKRQPPSEGYVVVADEQTEGRGQMGARWLSEKGSNLTCSILLRPEFLQPSQLYYLNKAISIAVRDAIAGFIRSATVTIKWPNDIYIDNGKVAGILIENSIAGQMVQYSIVGIGININQLVFDESVPGALSIRSVVGVMLDRYQVLDAVCRMIEQYYHTLKKYDFHTIDQVYDSFLYGRGIARQFMSGAEIFEGTVIRVNSEGDLLLDRSGEIHSFSLKEIKWLM